MNEHSGPERLAEAIALGEDVDWTNADLTDPVVRNLKLVAALSATLRDLKDVPAPRELEPGSAWGKLEILRLLDEGSTAHVYLARDGRLNREVALKVYHAPSAAGRATLLQEGRLLARIDHPGVVRVFGAAEHDGQVGIWMEPIQGETLARRLERGETLGPEEAVVWGSALCAALAALHGEGVVHGDIKAQNVMRRSDGRIVLMDLGAGRDRLETPDTSRLSGTPLYLAPEILDGVDPTTASDVYAVGVLLFHGLTGRFPFEAASVPELINAHIDGVRARLEDLRPGLPHSLRAVIEQAIQPDPGHRWPTAGDMQHALERCARVSGAGATERFAPIRRRWLFTALAALVTAAALWQFRSTPPEPPPAGHYAIEQRLLRLAPDASTEPLVNGATVAVGDLVVLDIATTEPTYVYVFNEDDRGRGHALFPLPGESPSNPLTGGEAHRLPGGNEPLAWRVDTEGGRERIHVVTSPEPLPELETLLDALPPARRGSNQSDQFTARGMGALDSVPTGQTPLSTTAAVAEVRRLTASGTSRGPRHQVVELVHRPR